MFSDSSFHNRVTELQQQRCEGVQVRAVSPATSSVPSRVHMRADLEEKTQRLCCDVLFAVAGGRRNLEVEGMTPLPGTPEVFSIISLELNSSLMSLTSDDKFCRGKRKPVKSFKTKRCCSFGFWINMFYPACLTLFRDVQILIKQRHIWLRLRSSLV